MDSTDQDLGALAIEVNQAHEHVMNGLNSSVAHAVHAGTLLLQVKTRVRHGAWLGWLRCNCTFSERTGQMYMRMAQKLPNLDPSKAQRVADLALREAVKLLSATNKDESSVPLDSPSPPRSQTSTESSPLVERLPNGHWQMTFKPNTTPETVRLKNAGSPGRATFHENG